jgi:hypothetical protein
MNIKTNFRQILDSVYSNETISGSLEYAFNPSEPFPNKGMLYIWDNEAKE